MLVSNSFNRLVITELSLKISQTLLTSIITKTLSTLSKSTSSKYGSVNQSCLPLLRFFKTFTGISRSSRHKRSETGAQRAHYRKKRKFELGRQPASTKLGPKRVHSVRVRGGNLKHRALRLESGNFAWGSEHVTRKTRIISVVCHFRIIPPMHCLHPA